MKLLSFDIGWRNLSYVFLHEHDKSYKIEDWKLVDLQSIFVKKKLSNREIMDRVLDYCDETLLETAKTCDVILLELQPAFSKKTMHYILSTMYAFFVLRLGHEKVRIISAKNKLGGLVPPKELKRKQAYQWKKKKAVEMTREFLSSDTGLNTWIPYFENHKPKLDDLADCLLQAKYYVENPPPKPSQPRLKKIDPNEPVNKRKRKKRKMTKK